MRVADWLAKGYALREAKKDLTTSVNGVDVAEGIPGNQSKCMVAHSYIRSYPNMEHIAVNQTTAYVIFKGEKIVWKYMIHDPIAKLLVCLNDLPGSGKMEDVIVRLSAPTESETREAKSEKNRKYKEKKRNEQQLNVQQEPKRTLVDVISNGLKKNIKDDPNCPLPDRKPALRRSNGMNALME